MSVSSPTIYLCGPITGCSFEEAKYGWREEVFSALMPEITCLSPLRHLHTDQLDTGDLKKMSPQGAKVGCLSTPRGLTERDRFDTLRSDLVFCNLLGATKISAGSMIELGWADAMRIPVLLIMEPGNVHDHAMVTALSSWIVPTLEEGIEVTRDLLIPGL